MKKIFLILAAILTLLLSGCQTNRGTDISAYSDTIAKAQEITVVSADTSEILEMITSKNEIENFVQSLDSDKWKLKALPDNTTKIGSFNLSQEETIKYGQTDTNGTLHKVATITLYDNSYISIEISGVEMTFAVSENTADYLKGYFS